MNLAREALLVSTIDSDMTHQGKLDDEVLAKYARLQGILHTLGSVLVAYSGGVDSALLLKVATDTLGSARAVGALASSVAYDDEETRDAERTAQEMGARLVRIETHE